VLGKNLRNLCNQWLKPGGGFRAWFTASRSTLLCYWRGCSTRALASADGYEELGLIKPARLSGRRFYSQRDIDRLHQIAYLTDELGINLAGVEVILRLKEQLLALQAENESMRAKLEAVTARLNQTTGKGQEPQENQRPD